MQKNKIFATLFLGIAEDDTCAKFEQNTINSTWVEAQKNFHPLKQNMLFFGKKEVFVKNMSRILHCRTKNYDNKFWT